MSVSKKRVLVIGAGRGQLGLYRAAREMGHTTIAASIPGNYPGLKMADETCYVDITNPASVAEAAMKLDIDAAVTCCMDTGVEALGAVNDALGLKGVSLEAARSSFDKVLQKKALIEQNIPTAQCVFASSVDDLALAENLFAYPLMLKKRHSQSSNGVFLVQDHASAHRVLSEQFADEGEFLIEEKLTGIEYGAQACIIDGDIKFVMVHGDLLHEAQAPFPVGHYIPSGMTNECQLLAIDAASRAIRASRFDNCAVNIDFIIDDEKIWIIELTGRAGANGLPELVGLKYGIDYYASIIKIALGESISLEEEPALKSAMVKMAIPEKYGKIQSIDVHPISAQVIDIRPFVEVGQVISRFDSSKDCIGQVAVLGNTIAECDRLANSQIAHTFSIE